MDKQKIKFIKKALSTDEEIELLSKRGLIISDREIALRYLSTVSNIFGYHPRVIESTLEPLRYTRNLCAHHSRIWNRWFLYAPKHLNAFGSFSCLINDSKIVKKGVIIVLYWRRTYLATGLSHVFGEVLEKQTAESFMYPALLMKMPSIFLEKFQKRGSKEDTNCVKFYN